MRNTDMDCNEAEAHLPLYVGGDLEAPLTAKVQAHLSSCAGCGGLLTAAEAARGALLGLVELEAVGSEPVDLWPGVRAGLLEAGLVGASADAASPTLGRVLSFARYFGGAAAAAALAMLVWRPWVGDLTPPALSGTSEELVQQDNQQDETGPGAVAAAEFGGVGSGGLEAGRSLGDPRTLSVAAPVRPVSTAGSTPVSTNGGFSGTGRLVSAGFPGSVASSAGQPPAGHTHRELLHTGAGPGGAHPLIQGGLRRVGPGDELLRDAARIYPEGPIMILPGHSHGGSSWSLASDEAELR